MGTEISGSTGIDKIQNDAVDIADLSATGTASASTFLRGDNSWTDALPTQSGNAGKFLTTDASTASWAEVVGGAGHIINVWSNYVNPAGSQVIANTGSQASNPDSLTNVLLTYRVFSKILSVTVNVASGNDLIVQYTGGQYDSNTMSSGCAYGYVIMVPDSSGNNRAYEFTRYNHYPAHTLASYGEDTSGSILVGEESGDTIATGDIEVSIYGYAYSEGNSQTFNIGKTTMIAMEVQR